MSSGSTSPPLLCLTGIEKSFSGTKVLHCVGFKAHPGQVVGLVGENGSGKSTTMNILAGILPGDAGTMMLDGAPFAPTGRKAAEQAGIGFIQQELNIFSNLSVAENLFLGRSPRLLSGLPLLARRKRREAARHWLSLVGLDVEPDSAAGRLSMGQRQLLEIARALSSDARVLIFDEPTTSLTARESAHLFKLIGDLRDKGHAILFISHVLDDVLALSDRVVALRDGSVTMDAANEGLSSQQLIHAMLGREIDALFPSRSPSGQAPTPLLEVRGLGAEDLLADIDFTIGSGEIVGIAGLMGAGRSELARVLFGLDPHERGTIHFVGEELASGDLARRLALGVAFLTEDRRREGVLAEASVSDNVALAALERFSGPAGALSQTRLSGAVRDAVAPLRLKSGPLATTAIRSLSGGNQQKALLARWLLCQPKLLILDEPTRGIDIGAKQDIYTLITDLAARGAGILIISSELEEVMGLSDRIIVLHRGRLVEEQARAQFDRETLLAAAFGKGRKA